MERDVQRFAHWLAEADLSPRTIDVYRSKIGQFIRWRGDRLLDEPLLYAYRDHLRDTSARPRTVKQSFIALRKWLAYLRAHGVAVPDIGQVKLPRLDAPIREVAEDEDLQSLFRAADSLEVVTEFDYFVRARSRIILALFAYTAIRRSELLGLNVEDVRNHGKQTYLHIRHGKGRQMRSILVIPELQRELDRWLAVRNDWERRMPGRETNRALLPVDRIRRLSKKGLDHTWARLIQRAGLQGRRLTPHCLRHWAATTMLEAEDATIKDVQAVLGHASLQTTMTYLHASERRIRAGLSQVGKKLGERVADTTPSPSAPRIDARQRNRQENDGLRRHYNRIDRRMLRQDVRRPAA